ncbi:MAG: CoA transferase [Deltaproteobacteria bacterium]|nr:CoA transferase [Deltaproteobacteria bacterium]
MTDRPPLKGVRVADFSWAWAGPYAAMELALFGAEVIKIESMKRLDHVRLRALGFGHFRGADASPFFNDLNMNKLSVTLDLGHPKAVEIAKKIVSISDIMLQNMRPGVMDRLGFSYEAMKKVKPDIIYLSSSACGATGPDREYVGYAPTFGALGGGVHLTGYPDMAPQPLTGSVDLRSAATSAFIMLAALVHRQRTGEGQHIDVSSQETITALIGDALMEYTMNGRSRTRRGNEDDAMAPHNVYRCRDDKGMTIAAAEEEWKDLRRDDKWVTIAVATEEEWKALTEVLDNPVLKNDARFADAYSRHTNREALDRIIETWTRERTPNEVMTVLQRAGVAAVPSFNSEALAHDPHLKERNAFIELDHSVMGKRVVVAPHWRMSETPVHITRPAPLLGGHNRYVFCDLLGMSPQEVEDLEKDKVIY